MKPQELGRLTYISLESSFPKHSKNQYFKYLLSSRKIVFAATRQKFDFTLTVA